MDRSVSGGINTLGKRIEVQRSNNLEFILFKIFERIHGGWPVCRQELAV